MASLRTLLTGTAASSLKKHLIITNARPKLAATTSLAPHRLQLLPTTKTFTFRPLSAPNYSTFIVSDSDSEAADEFCSDSEEAVEIFSDESKRGIFPYENPFLKAGNRNVFEMHVDDEAAKLRFDFPGVGKEGLKIWFENGNLKIEGTEDATDVDGVPKEGRKYAVTYEIFEPGLLKKDEAKAEMKNGVLKVVIPMVKFEERKEVVHVNVA
ncbi:heat shock 22 kDa protein, mitochondrial-like [Coffea arabica]|uniref:Heat shock 22 kDa protein, mitochondrial-like n=1 Tax=Coffea arabica TaxID=13443 RepID=A0ABM4VEW7_COFAR|nr:heat shock 22 kDa protein, mitochondrial-like [Coffea arabica]